MYKGKKKDYSLQTTFYHTRKSSYTVGFQRWQVARYNNYIAQQSADFPKHR